jgi:hypothetical protein
LLRPARRRPLQGRQRRGVERIRIASIDLEGRLGLTPGRAQLDRAGPTLGQGCPRGSDLGIARCGRGQQRDRAGLVDAQAKLGRPVQQPRGEAGVGGERGAPGEVAGGLARLTGGDGQLGEGVEGDRGVGTGGIGSQGRGEVADRPRDITHRAREDGALGEHPGGHASLAGAEQSGATAAGQIDARAVLAREGVERVEALGVAVVLEQAVGLLERGCGLGQLTHGLGGAREALVQLGAAGGSGSAGSALGGLQPEQRPGGVAGQAVAAQAQREIGEVGQDAGILGGQGVRLLQRGEPVVAPTEPGVEERGQLAQRRGGGGQLPLLLAAARPALERLGKARHIAAPSLQPHQLGEGREIVGDQRQDLAGGAGGEVEVLLAVAGRSDQAVQERQPRGAGG